MLLLLLSFTVIACFIGLLFSIFIFIDDGGSSEASFWAIVCVLVGMLCYGGARKMYHIPPDITVVEKTYNVSDLRYYVNENLFYFEKDDKSLSKIPFNRIKVVVDSSVDHNYIDYRSEHTNWNFLFSINDNTFETEIILYVQDYDNIETIVTDLDMSTPEEDS